MSAESKTLAEFGAETLRIMEAHQEWSADTMEEISIRAYGLGLARNNAFHEFTRTEEGKQ